MAGENDNIPLREKVTAAIGGCAEAMTEIGDRLELCVQQLRVHPSEDTFNAVTMLIDNLQSLNALVIGISQSCAYTGIPADAFSSWQQTGEIFSSMEEAFSRSDWLSFADLLQYELHPKMMELRDSLVALLKQLN